MVVVNRQICSDCGESAARCSGDCLFQALLDEANLYLSFLQEPQKAIIISYPFTVVTTENTQCSFYMIPYHLNTYNYIFQFVFYQNVYTLEIVRKTLISGSSFLWLGLGKDFIVN